VDTYVHAHDISSESSVIIEDRSGNLRNNDAKDVNKASIGRYVKVIHVENEERQYNRIDE
jgi:hypothetical protein